MAVAGRKAATDEQPHSEVVAERNVAEQPEIVADRKAASDEQPQPPEVVAQPQQQEAKSAPRFSSVFSGIRARLEHIFEPRNVVAQPHQFEAVAQPQQPEVVAETDKRQQPQQPEVVVETGNRQEQQPPQAAAGVQQQQQKSEVVYASLVFPQPKVQEPNNATTIQAPSMKLKRAPPPPVLQKPKMPYAGISRVGTLPRPRKTPMPAEGASSQAASSMALNQAVPTRQAPPPPPQRRSSLRNLSRLRRTRSMPMRDFSKRDLPVQFLNDYDLWDEDECFVSYV